MSDVGNAILFCFAALIGVSLGLCADCLCPFLLQFGPACIEAFNFHLGQRASAAYRSCKSSADNAMDGSLAAVWHVATVSSALRIFVSILSHSFCSLYDNPFRLDGPACAALLF